MPKNREEKRRNINKIVSDVTAAYRDTGNSTDPEGMYTGVVQSGTMGTEIPEFTSAAEMAPTSAVDGGKVYRSVEELQLERDRYAPQQDADDL